MTPRVFCSHDGNLDKDTMKGNRVIVVYQQYLLNHVLLCQNGKDMSVTAKLKSVRQKTIVKSRYFVS